ncbi:DNA polymerase beta superfamily protein [Planomonospora sp. ID82291]|uniref:nucleotidyltransferase domain-containing protein n=1 Tax=Planomonospora sp. ID82291 TaxID=2738136 RepID=UPI0018C3B925|nr:nucleotidyltransferase domain-containing protein [Planomonospora sp. ID82291]MBG0818750.1 nucleotidyltransferase domain-containing protein [Planomonospora sp. ID82291]
MAAAPHTLLLGVVGSTAYGLTRPGSDIDRLGVFAAPTIDLVGLERPTESVVTTAPDRTLHEAAKAVRLLLSGNPTATEILWLPDDLYEVRTRLGEDLIAIRSAFLCAPRVRSAYLGYAVQQFQRLSDRGDGSFSSDTCRRTAKHARHLARLLHQGLELYRSGHLQVRVADPQALHDFGDQVADGDVDAARELLARTEAAFDAARSPLPDQPDRAAAEAWLRSVRIAHWEA